MIPAEKAMIDIARQVEAIGERLGWGNPAILGFVYRGDGGYGTILSQAQPQQINEDPVEGLTIIANSYFRGTDSFRRRLEEADATKDGDDLAGIWFVAEGWQVIGGDAERTDDEIQNDPTSKELRFVVLLDCGGRVYFVDRVRGEKPEAEMQTAGGMRVSGPIVDALRRIMLALGSNMPDGSCDLEAIGRLDAASPFTS